VNSRDEYSFFRASQLFGTTICEYESFFCVISLKRNRAYEQRLSCNTQLYSEPTETSSRGVMSSSSKSRKCRISRGMKLQNNGIFFFDLSALFIMGLNLNQKSADCRVFANHSRGYPTEELRRTQQENP